MIYEEYYRKYLKYKKIYTEVNKLENKRIEILGLVDIQSSSTNNLGSNNSENDKMTNYLIQLEKTEKKLSYKKRILKEVKEQLKEKESELRESKEELDRVYLYKYIDRLKWYQVATKISYGKTKVYELINEIDKNLAKIKSAEKNGKSLYYNCSVKD